MDRVTPASGVPTPSEVRQAYLEELPPAQRTSLVSWLAFTATFGIVRAITYSIRDGKGPLRDIKVGGVHIHHYLWGILSVSSVAGISIRGTDPRTHHPVLATAYGAGMALIVDEFALLLDLKDVYWAKQGRISVDLGIGAIATGGSVYVGRPILKRLRRNRA
jgi:hypothetical protein